MGLSRLETPVFTQRWNAGWALIKYKYVSILFIRQYWNPKDKLHSASLLSSYFTLFPWKDLEEIMKK